MAPAEVAHRVGEAARRRASRGRHEGWARYPAIELQSPFPQWPARIRKAGTEQRAAIHNAAQRALAGQYSALGRDWPRRDPSDLFPTAAWLLDPVTGTAWPSRAYCFDIDFRSGARRGDVKYVWEFNRLQFLPVLAAHALLEEHRPSIAAIEKAVASWHNANPPFRGVGWASGIEVALRAISLVATYAILGDRLSTETRERIAAILGAGVFWLQRFPSRFSSANNHLVAELAGEFLTARALGHDASVALRKLTRQIELQILPDGAPAEQSPTYGAFTAELALLCVDSARQLGVPFAPIVEQRLAAFADFTGSVGAARYGDDDEGRALTLGDESVYQASVASAIAGAVGTTGRAVGDFRNLILGSPPVPADTRAGLKTFPHGGLSVWRGSLAHRMIDLAFDHGPLGYLSIAAHGHADALSVTLSVDGVPVLVDPGTYLYGLGGAWRDWFRSTPAHNTLNLDGQSQSLMTGPFNWSQKAVTTLIETRPEPEWLFRASHDGYQRRFGTAHERTIHRDGDGLVIADRLIGAAHPAEIVFQIAPDLTIERDGVRVIISGQAVPLLAMEMPDDSFEVRSGSGDDVASGWVSPSFGVKVPAPRIVWRGLVGADGVVTRLRVQPTAPNGSHSRKRAARAV